MNKTVGFIGCGNMGGALIRAAAKAVPGSQILISDIDEEKAQRMAAEVGAVAVDLRILSEKAEIIFLGVKPQVMATMLSDIREVLSKRQDQFLLITMAAGLSIEKIYAMVGEYPCIRIMPNLPVAVEEGMILWTEQNTNASNEEDFLFVLQHAGKLLKIKESLIDAGSAISGCGPAFACLFIEALSDGGVAKGLSREDAYIMAEQMVLGTAKFLLESGMSPAELKDRVCSPGGTTIAGVSAMEKGAFRASLISAVEAVDKRSKELAGK